MSCGPGNHLKANPVCEACGVNAKEEQRELRIQHRSEILDLRQQLALAVKPIAKEFVERSVGHIDAVSKVEMGDGDVRAILIDTLSAVLTEEGF